jgi:HD-GYP domain-containing protein (c-di-GMP phosphodiesterase class II)
LNLTLLVENNPRIESFYMLNLTTWLGLETMSKKKAEFAVKFLEENPGQVNLIIVRSRIEKEASAKLIIEYLKIKGLNTPVIVIGPGDFGAVPHVANSLDLKLLIKSAASALNITAKDMSAKVVPDFFPIPILYFNVIKRSVVKVFSQDIDSPGKYTPRLEKDKEIDTKVIQSMVQEGLTHLYVDKMDRLAFVSNVTSELISMLEQENLSEDEQLSATDKGLELLSRKLLTIGLTEETIALSKKNMASIRENVKKNPKMSKLLERLLANKSSYLFKHTQILTYVSLHIIHNIDWGNEEQEEKISFICFFHDIALENDIHCQIKTTNELRAANLTAEQKSLVEKHAQLAAEFVQKFPHAPMGTDQIIRQHHGQLNGMGFSDHYGANVSPMSIVFIVAEEFTRIIMKRENGPFNRDEMMKELKSEFPTSRFAKVVEKLQTLTI